MKFIFLFTLLWKLAFAVDPLVSTKVGLIKGLRGDSGYSKFLGIPYGKVGSNVFGAAEPHPAFDDIFEAYDDTISCIQMGGSAVIGVIDCLRMNIYVPDSANSNNRLPVMVSIHGGSFIGGSDNEGDPLSLLRHDVIIVSINYRLGIFGFMCLGIPEVPGNTGLKDQTLALRWINENIEAFGGDVNQITIFGGSAGGMSTNLHLFSSNEKLFDKAIIQSGPATSYWMMVESDRSIPFRIAEELGFNTTDIYEALSFISEVNAQTVTGTAHNLMITDASGTNQPLTKPCVEQVFEGVEHFITEHPMNMKSSKASTIPIIIGYNNVELAFQLANIEANFFETYDFRQHFALGFDMNNDLAEPLEAIKHFYVGDDDISENVRWEIINFATDFIFGHSTQRMAQQLLESGAKSVYRYVFSYSGSDVNKTWSGAAHGDEKGYLFDTRDDEEKTWVDQQVVDRLTELWTNFAKYGDPTPITSELIPVKWTPITKTTQPFLEIDAELTLKSRPYHNRMAFWDLFYKQYGHYQKWYKA